ncbi:MAG: glutamate-1-semialdehyde 2,1-aminomutase [Thermaerobacterales bacterium]
MEIAGGGDRAAKNSAAWYERARRVIPGGVNSPVRAFKSVGADPIFINNGRGPYIIDEDGRSYLDYVMSWGCLILGHADPEVTAEVKAAAEGGLGYGAATRWEVELAEMLCTALPAVERVRLVSSGTEAAMSALRLARAFTGRDVIVKFAGCYHGHVDSLLAEAGSGLLTYAIPGTPGVPAAVIGDTYVLPYNNLDACRQLFAEEGHRIAAVIVEPVAANMGVVPPAPEFLSGLRQLTARHDALLIFDEVITGFRVGPAGAQGLFDIQPDLTCLGKIIGGGLPVGAYGGRADIMSQVAPEGPVYQAGTLAGNPLAVRAGLITLRRLAAGRVYARIEQQAAALAGGLEDLFDAAGLAHRIQRVGSLMTVFFTDQPVTDLATARRSDTGLHARFFRGMLDVGIYLAPSQFEALFLSAAHGDEAIEQTLSAAGRVLSRLGG